jgi:hypothetical protein
VDKQKLVGEWDLGLPPLGVIIHWCAKRIVGGGIDDDRGRGGDILGANHNRHGDDLNAVK